jgi:hypothetical protein
VRMAHGPFRACCVVAVAPTAIPAYDSRLLT